MERLNCWEILKCELQYGGKKAEERGVCPASTIVFADGLNGGTCAGRACWAIEKTLCGNTIQKGVREKQKTCRTCKVFQIVQTEEGDNFVPLAAIREELQSYTCY